MSDTPRKTFGRRTAPVTVEQVPAATVYAQPMERLRQLFAIEYEMRNPQWDEEFLRLIPHARFTELDKETMNMNGHYAFPVTLDDAGALDFMQAVRRAVEAGDGLAIMTLGVGRENADMVFSAGQLISAYSGDALLPLDTKPAGPVGESSIMEGSTYITANPSEKILPVPIRRAMREWLADEYGILVTLICLRMEGFAQGQEIKTMAFHFGDLQLDPEVRREVLSGLYWFLPPDISPGMFSGMDMSKYHPL